MPVLRANVLASWLACTPRLTLKYSLTALCRPVQLATMSHSTLTNESHSQAQHQQSQTGTPLVTKDENLLTDPERETIGANSSATDMATLSPVELIARINDLEAQLKSTTARLSALTTTTSTSAAELIPPNRNIKPKKKPKIFDFSRYSTRHIALKFAYLGQRYNGFEYANGSIAPPKPTIEEVLWKALRKARFIPTEVPEGCDGSFDVVYDERDRLELYRNRGVKLHLDWTGLAYSKCGRTDRGVSAFGQVIGIRVRSNRPKQERVSEEQEQDGIDASESEDTTRKEQTEFDDVKDELPYVAILNSILPTDIRVLACCLNPDPSFDARFSCEERRYKYFFTNPAFCPAPGTSGLVHASANRASIREGWLDIEAMRKAAKKLEGLHDFRNFCKIDASKQMSSCERRITFADIEERPGGGLGLFTPGSGLGRSGGESGVANGVIESVLGRLEGIKGGAAPNVYTFAVHGTAFLWHQVRCMVAILFLVGQGLEKPEIVDQLLDITQNPARPHYEMADDAPLVLWECVFPEGESGDDGGLNWTYVGDEASIAALSKKGDNQSDGKFGMGGLVNELWIQWHEAKMREVLTAGLLDLALNQGDGTSLQRGGSRTGKSLKSPSQRVFGGGDNSRSVGDYIPVMQKQRLDTLEVQNAKHLASRQTRRDHKESQLAESE